MIYIGLFWGDFGLCLVKFNAQSTLVLGIGRAVIVTCLGGNMTIKETLNYSALFDFYGALLTQVQQDMVYDYIILNESFAEIASNRGITKQAVSDVLNRALKKLDYFEEKLNLVAKFKKILGRVDKVAAELFSDEATAKVVAERYKELIKSLED